MAGELYDKTNSRLQVTFRQEEMWTRVTHGSTAGGFKAALREAKKSRKIIKSKWLYVFWSEGKDYAAGLSTNTLPQRVSYVFAGQHCARMGRQEKNPKKTAEHAKHPYVEVWFDDTGRMFANGIAKSYKTPRHQRRHPVDVYRGKYGKKEPGRTSLQLPVKRNGQDVRYYFLLSSVRLGPKALEACVEKGGGDGLSFWCLRTYLKEGTVHTPIKVQAPTADLLEQLSEAPAGSDDHNRLRELAEVGVVDPYHLAGDLSDNHFRRALDRYIKLMDDIQKGRPGGRKIDPRHLNRTANRGSLNELYFIAKALSTVRRQMLLKRQTPFKWDESAARQIIDFVEKTVNQMRNSCEASAQFLGNWLDSPAHHLIDLAVVHDTADEKDEAAREDRAYGLQHWYNIVTRLGLTSRGSSFLAHLAGKDPNNPVQALLMKYRQAGQKRTAGPGKLEFDVLALTTKIIPDLVLNWVMMDMQDGAAKKPDHFDAVAEKSKAFVEVMNNLGYFPKQIGKVPAAKASKYESVANYVKRGVFVVETDKKIANALMDYQFTKEYHALRKSLEARRHTGRYFQKLYGWSERQAPSIWRWVDRSEKFNSPVPMVKFFLAMGNIAFGQAANAKALGDSSGIKRFEGAVELALAGAELFDAIMGLNGIDKVKWTEMAKVRAQSGSWVARAGVALSIIGIVSAVWVIYTNLKEADQAWDNRDSSTMVGAGIAVIGGALLAANGICVFVGATTGIAGALASTGVGIVAAIIVFAGGLIIAFWKDDIYETFAKSSYFADDADDRNYRKFGGKDHWAGKEPTDQEEWAGGSRNWPVAHQAAALRNLMSRFVLSTKATEDGKQYVKPATCTLSELSLRLRYPVIPVGSSFTLDFMQPNSGGHKEIVYRLRYHPDGHGRKRRRIYGTPGSPDVNWTVKETTNPDSIDHTFKFSNVTQKFHELYVRASLHRPDGSYIKLDGMHKVLSVYMSERMAMVNVTINSDASGPADKFYNLKFPSWK